MAELTTRASAAISRYFKFRGGALEERPSTDSIGASSTSGAARPPVMLPAAVNLSARLPWDANPGRPRLQCGCSTDRPPGECPLPLVRRMRPCQSPRSTAANFRCPWRARSEPGPPRIGGGEAASRTARCDRSDVACRSMELTSGQVAVITGAGSGIGKALAQRLVAEGLRVVIADIDEAK